MLHSLHWNLPCLEEEVFIDGDGRDGEKRSDIGCVFEKAVVEASLTVSATAGLWIEFSAI
jgi:hypothetical protein